MLVRGVIVMVVGLVLGGCGAPAPVVPVSPFPPRPVAIDLSGVDLCATLTRAQKDARGIDRERFRIGDVGGEPSPGCLWNSDGTGARYTVQIIEAPASGGLTEDGSWVIEVAGYGAVREPVERHNTDRATPFCQIPIDVNDTQSVRVQVSGGLGAGDGDDPAAVEGVCRETMAFGADVLGNLRR